MDPDRPPFDPAILDGLAEATGDMISLMRPDGEIDYASPTHLAFMGFDAFERPVRLRDDWIHPDDRPRVREAIARALETGERGTLEYRLVDRTGRTRWVDSHYGAADLPGLGRRFVAVSRAADDHVATRESLAESEQRYRLLADGASDVLWVMGPDLKTRFMSPSVERQLGYTVDEYLALPLEARLPEASVREVVARYRLELARAQELATRGERHAFTMELLHRHKDGHLLWGELHVGFLYDERMNVTGIHGVTRNIDDRKRAEEALARRERHYRRLFEENRAALGLCQAVRDADGRVADYRYVEVNPAFALHTGLAVERVAGRLASEVFPPDELHAALPAIARLSSGVTLHGERDYPSLGRRLDFTLWSLDEDRFVLMFEDVTARRRMEEEMARAQKLESLGLLAGGIAHDFNNILTGILGNVSMVRARCGHDGSLLTLLEAAEEACDRARDLTQQLLTFSRGGEPVKAEASLSAVLRQAADFVLAGSNVSCAYRFAPGGLRAWIDRGQVAQVVQNLVLNAVQAMPDGGTIELGADRVDLAAGSVPPLGPGAYVRFWVRDQGEGIRPEHRDKLFDPYFTTKENGVGLGLPVAFSIVRRHGGAIVVDSEPGRGATFTVYLPAGPAGDAEAGPRPAAVQLPCRRVLVMDDEPVVREVMGRMLTLLGYETTTVRDGEEAIRMYERHLQRRARFDLVLMDLTVPGGMGGKAALRGILALDPGARAIVMSGYSNDPVMANHAAHGFRDVLPKPVKLPDLKAALARALADPELGPGGGI